MKRNEVLFFLAMLSIGGIMWIISFNAWKNDHAKKEVYKRIKPNLWLEKQVEL